MKKNAYILGCAFVACLLLAGYVSSYLMTTEETPTPFWHVHGHATSGTVRLCKFTWMKTAFLPLAKIEELLTGEVITLISYDEKVWGGTI
jgi:hypothetical protein